MPIMRPIISTLSPMNSVNIVFNVTILPLCWVLLCQTYIKAGSFVLSLIHLGEGTPHSYTGAVPVGATNFSRMKQSGM
jgi:hypothetical protein